VDELIALAGQQLERVKVVLKQLGLQYVDLEPTFAGVGVAVGFGETEYSVLTVIGGGLESQLIVTSGILKDIVKDRPAALETVNRCNQQNSFSTVYLHDAEAGWALLMQRTTPLEVFLDVPGFLGMTVRTLALAVQELRKDIAGERNIGGQPWQWTEQDRAELLIRSMV
jgi:hypothetical protein